MYRYLSLAWLGLLVASCTASASTEQIHQLIGKANQQNTYLIAKANQNDLQRLEERKRGILMCQILYEKSSNITRLTDTLIQQIEQGALTDVDSVCIKVQETKEDILAAYASLWDNGGIKGSVFANEQKKRLL